MKAAQLVKTLHAIERLFDLGRKREKLLTALQYQLLRKLYPDLKWENNPLDYGEGKCTAPTEGAAMRSALKLFKVSHGNQSKLSS